MHQVLASSGFLLVRLLCNLSLRRKSNVGRSVRLSCFEERDVFETAPSRTSGSVDGDCPINTDVGSAFLVPILSITELCVKNTIDFFQE